MGPSLELAVVREALQSRLLVELMGNAVHKELVLKGGMAMRAVHGSVRYTKDIDLDADLKYSKERIQGHRQPVHRARSVIWPHRQCHGVSTQADRDNPSMEDRGHTARQLGATEFDH